MKRILVLLLTLALISGAYAETGIEADTLLPSAEFAIGRKPNADYGTGGNRTQIYRGFTEEDYEALSLYLGARGCKSKSAARREYVLTLDIVKGDTVIAFTYDRQKQTATLKYPSGAALETERTDGGEEKPALPALDSVYGELMPNASAVLGRAGDPNYRFSDGKRDDWLTYRFFDVSYEDYTRFGSYCAQMGCVYSDSKIQPFLYAGEARKDSRHYAIDCDLKKGDAVMEVLYYIGDGKYDFAGGVLTVKYSFKGYPEDTVALSEPSAPSALPPCELLSVRMPSASAVLGRRPDRSETIDEGMAAFYYENVSGREANAFKDYARACGCDVQITGFEEDYYPAEVYRDAQVFYIEYGYRDHILCVYYPLGTHPERVSLPLDENAAAGDLVTFGKYEQDGDEENGKEAIEWLVLDRFDDGSLLLISRYALDAGPYDAEYADTSWEACSLRGWLNGDFLAAAFSPQERSRLSDIVSRDNENPVYGSAGSADTVDKVTIPSIAEAAWYFRNDYTRMCAATAFAAKNGAVVSSGYKTWDEDLDCCTWWLRNLGSTEKLAALVNNNGYIAASGKKVSDKTRGIRPMILLLPYAD